MTTWHFTCLQEEGEALISANLHYLYLHPCKEWEKDTKELISGLVSLSVSSFFLFVVVVCLSVVLFCFCFHAVHLLCNFH